MPRFGVTTFPTDYGISVVDLARAVEERGLDSIFFNEHTHIPVSRRTAFPGGGDLPEEYSHTHDPFVALAAAAAVLLKCRGDRDWDAERVGFEPANDLTEAHGATPRLQRARDIPIPATLAKDRARPRPGLAIATLPSPRRRRRTERLLVELRGSL